MICIAEEAHQAHQRVADHSRAQMANMHRFGDVRPAKIDDGDFGISELVQHLLSRPPEYRLRERRAPHRRPVY